MADGRIRVTFRAVDVWEHFRYGPFRGCGLLDAVIVRSILERSGDLPPDVVYHVEVMTWAIRPPCPADSRGIPDVTDQESP